MAAFMNRMSLAVTVVVSCLCARQAWTQSGMPREPSTSAEKPAADDCGKRGQPRIGMTAAQAMETCWGKPARTVARVTHDSLEEQLIYPDGRVLKFRNGLLMAILEKQ
jgi:hypothetical protein